MYGVEQTSSNPIGGGGFADVYEGKFHDKQVALKVLRIYGSQLHEASLHQV